MTDAERYNRTKVVICYLLYCGWLAFLKAFFPLFDLDMAIAMIEAVSWIPALYVGVKTVETIIDKVKQPVELKVTKKVEP